MGAHGGQAQAEAAAVANILVLGVLQLLQQVVGYIRTVVSMDETQRVQATALGVARARTSLLRQVALHQGERLSLVTSMNHSQWCGGRQLGPISRTGQPVKVVSQELIAGGAAVHERIRDNGGSVADGHPHGLLGGSQDLQVSVIAADEELQLEVDGDLTR